MGCKLGWVMMMIGWSGGGGGLRFGSRRKWTRKAPRMDKNEYVCLSMYGLSGGDKRCYLQRLNRFPPRNIQEASIACRRVVVDREG